MTEAGERHPHIVRVAKIYGLLIFHGAPRLNYRFNALLVCNLHTVGEGKEGVGSHHGALQREAEFFCLFNGFSEWAHPGFFVPRRLPRVARLWPTRWHSTWRVCKFLKQIKAPLFQQESATARSLFSNRFPHPFSSRSLAAKRR